MAKWLREYFNLWNHKTRNPPQPPKPDYSKKKPNSESACQESDLMRAYRLQKEKDFEDPYNNGPGSSLRRLRAMCQEHPEDDKSAEKRLMIHANPLLYRSCSERKAGSSPSSKYTSPKHRLIRVDSTPVGHNNITWSLSTNSETLHKSDENNFKETVAMRDDYSDPFDAKDELKNKVIKKREVENNGYMEPYEAQKMMAEIHKQESQKKAVQLYDTPYELEGNEVASDTESNASYLSESKLPQDDTRPAEEYDQPWEWNKVTVPTLAAQFNGIEKRQSSPLCDRRRQLRPSGLIKHGGLEFCGIIGERVDPNTPLEKQVWYHGAIGRTDAENLLRLRKECSYLIRNSQSNKNDYSLSLKSSQGFMHMKLTRTKDKYILGENSLPFDSIPEVIHHYTTRRLPIKGAEHLSLLYPVTVRTL
ncbi:SH2 domain-containing adapter protein B-like [Carcharodon carcharias]|uniref:SH2 domain-containing adapter protein B-like n=1 Tax=Carcharodon carcharias TaxID=13397 RepID=UPI001B7F689F|nr:SH2 domain-containing adapter protein B-like [Carcharodon carcharias]